MSVLHNMSLTDNQVVIFLDILGFSEITLRNENTTSDSKGFQVLMKSIIDIFCDFDSIYYENEKKIKILWVSDSIVITTDANNINSALEVLGQIINEFYTYHFALRGAITLGKLYHEKNIWGPAFVRAVRYEKTANFPRIIINKSDFEKMSIDNGYIEHFKPTEDNSFFYFDYFDHHFSAEKENIGAASGLYSDFISSGLRESKVDKVFAKYLWLADSFKNNLIKHSKRIDDICGPEHHLKLIDKINRSILDGFSTSLINKSIQENKAPL